MYYFDKGDRPKRASQRLKYLRFRRVILFTILCMNYGAQRTEFVHVEQVGAGRNRPIFLIYTRTQPTHLSNLHSDATRTSILCRGRN